MVVTGKLSIHLSGWAMPAEMGYGGQVFRREGPEVAVSELPDTAMVTHNVNYHDPSGRKTKQREYNMLAQDQESGLAWYVYCRAGHFNIPDSGLPISRTR